MPALNPATQYATDANLRARQRLWQQQQPPFDLVGWVLDQAGVRRSRDGRVLDVGCGNGLYLRRLRELEVEAVGCDLSTGMLAAAAGHGPLVNGDVVALPFATAAFPVVLAPHMLYHVSDREAAAREMRRVLSPGGVCVAVTNGKDHMRSLRAVVEAAVRVATPGWTMGGLLTFSMENGEPQLRTAFERVERVRAPSAPFVVTDADIAAGYIASLGDHYQPETSRPWPEVVDAVRVAVQRQIDATGAFTVSGDTGAFICS